MITTSGVTAEAAVTPPKADSGLHHMSPISSPSTPPSSSGSSLSSLPSSPVPPLPLRCRVCGATAGLKCCSRCRSVYYCCRQHQELDWKTHRFACNQLVGGQHRPRPHQPSPQQLLQQQHHHNQQQLHRQPMDAGVRAVSYATTTVGDTSLDSRPDGQHSYGEHVSDLLMTPNGGGHQQTLVNGVNAIASGHQRLPQPSHTVTNGTIDNNNHQSMIGGATATTTSATIQHMMAPTMHRSAVAAPPHDLILTKLNSYCESIVRDLNEFGFCVIDDFLSNGADILSEVHTLYKCGHFRAGQVVNTKATVNSQLIRGDHIVWVDGTEQDCANIGFLVQTLDSIVIRCNAMSGDGEFAKYRINRRTKAMIACYPGNNSQYVRHIDNPNNDGRCVTSIYYLNKDYNRQRDGGVLRLFPQISSCVADIEPKFNRVIFFWSDRRNPHEVMPSSRMRFAITVWYFDANERELAIQRYKQESRLYPVDKDLRPF